MEMGENVQIDHMTVTKNGCVFKDFAAWERFSKYVYANVYADAKSSTAEKFLRELVEKIPYKIKSIQVDGGSEFMKISKMHAKNLVFHWSFCRRLSPNTTEAWREPIAFAEKSFMKGCKRILSVAQGLLCRILCENTTRIDLTLT